MERERKRRPPWEVWLPVLSWLDLRQATEVCELVGPEFRRACVSQCQERLLRLRASLNSNVVQMVTELGGSPLVLDEDRLNIAGEFLFLNYLIGETNVLIALSWRYRADDEAFGALAGPLLPAIDELDRLRRDRQELLRSGLELTSLRLKGLLSHFYQFLVQYDSELQERIAQRRQPVPFETQLIDVLSCCPTADFKLTVVRPDRASSYSIVVADYYLRNLKCVYQVPDDKYHGFFNNLGKQSKLFKFVRDLVRCDNTVYYQNIVNELKEAEAQYSDSFSNQAVQQERFSELYERYQRVWLDLYRTPTYSTFDAELNRQKFVNDVYRRETTDRPGRERSEGVRVRVHLPCVESCHLPLMVSEEPALADLSTSRAHDKVVKALLKEYCRALRLPLRPQAEVTTRLAAGLRAPGQTVLSGVYDSQGQFRIKRVDK